MTDFLRRMLFSKQFFGVLLAVLTLDLSADLAEMLNPGRHEFLNGIAIGVDLVAFGLALWMFLDLNRRRDRDGNDSRRR
jgi:hypothetical protein